MAPELIVNKGALFPGDVYPFSILCADVVNNQQWMPPGRVDRDRINAVRGGAPPTLADVPQPLIELAQTMWEANPKARPKFAEIAASVENPEYWINGMDAHAFREYAIWLREEHRRTPKPPRGLADCLYRAIWVLTLIRRIGPVDKSGPVVQLLTCLIAGMATDDPEEAEKLNTSLEQQLDAGCSFVHVEAQSGSEELAPPREEDEELPEEDRYRLRIVRGWAGVDTEILLRSMATGEHLYQQVMLIVNGDVWIQIG
jgi:hypothetical protein